MKAIFFASLSALTLAIAPIVYAEPGHPRRDRPEKPQGQKPEKPIYHKPPVAHKPDRPEPHKPSKPEEEKPSGKPVHNPAPHKPAIGASNTNTNNTAIAGAQSSSSSTSSAFQQQQQQQSIKNVNNIKIDNRTSSLSSLHLETQPVYSTLGSAGSTGTTVFNINGGAANDGWGSDTSWFGTIGIQIPVNSGGDRQAIRLHKCVQILSDARSAGIELDVSEIKVCKDFKVKQVSQIDASNATPESVNTSSSSSFHKVETPETKKIPIRGLW